MNLNTKNAPAKVVIHMIVRGPTDGDSERARRAYVRRTRDIIESDCKAPVEDSMIHLGLASAQGVYADVLFYRVHQQMEAVNTLMYSFISEVVHPLGQILLPLSLGVEPT
ncbi:UNVERIFIED_CONTAM: hypothetical protein Sradi_6661500 [Sesamum radiatum]|uniref:Uncharacterized protein n=1 Tax=Sesamum radiatum TaxID=300843 RepID=A0AAW2JNZ8_SESRA